MYYICIENAIITSILNYEPNVPESVKVVNITDEDYDRLESKTHYFDVVDNTIKSVPSQELENQTISQQNGLEREFLNQTDWKVLRHIREQALGITTSLTQSEYLELERQRQSAAQRIVDIE